MPPRTAIPFRSLEAPPMSRARSFASTLMLALAWAACGGNVIVDGQGTKCETASDCGTGEMCDPSTQTCVTGVPPCASDADCASGTCDVTTGVCVPGGSCGCSSDADCQPGQVCDASGCCTSGAHC